MNFICMFLELCSCLINSFLMKVEGNKNIMNCFKEYWQTIVLMVLILFIHASYYKFGRKKKEEGVIRRCKKKLNLL
jgi:hypothetical protein